MKHVCIPAIFWATSGVRGSWPITNLCRYLFRYLVNPPYFCGWNLCLMLLISIDPQFSQDFCSWNPHFMVGTSTMFWLETVRRWPSDWGVPWCCIGAPRSEPKPWDGQFNTLIIRHEYKYIYNYIIYINVRAVFDAAPCDWRYPIVVFFCEFLCSVSWQLLCTCWITTCWLLSSTAAKRVFFELPREAVQYDHVTDSRETKILPERCGFSAPSGNCNIV